MKSFNDMTISELLDCLKKDFELLKTGEWIPDNHSISASAEVVERIRELIPTPISTAPSHELLEDIIEAFPGFITDEDVNGGDLVDYIGGMIARYEESRPRPKQASLALPACQQPRLQG